MNAPVIPNQVLLFSGHMIDAPDRKTPRFPADKEPIAREAIEALFDQLAAGPQGLAICGGACGGDLLFAEAALARGVALEMYLPFDVSTFLPKSVTFAGGDWLSRFKAAKAACELHILPAERGALKDGEDPYEQNNLWMLEAASRFGTEKVQFICLWDGKGGDGPGGTQHLMEEVRNRHGHTHRLDTTQLWS
ncbi:MULTISPECIES: hypothetical protein [unclassified Variovorax]|uniref:hypothetical protein n=1 Tax=unclassified Variovorax TaxID=663243 RepID=UPI001BD4CDAD|nr:MULTISPECIES: hypothetical protein [unclassified Variovorax]